MNSKAASSPGKTRSVWQSGALKAWTRIRASDGASLILLSIGWFIFMVLVAVVSSRQYGFHRDELAFLDNARHLAWGYVEYPPLVPFLAWVAQALFGLSLVGIRTFPILATCLILLVTAGMVRELGGSRRAQILAGLATVTAPLLLFNGLFFSYEVFDFLWWVLLAYLVIRLLKSENPRWWLGIGAVIGLGAMTKYTMAFAVLGLAAGMLLTPARRSLRSPWLWAGGALALVICLPNLVWQAQHQWIALQFTRSIHARDIALGRTSLLSYLVSQFYICTNAGAIPLWISGFWYLARRPEGRTYRALAWMAVVPFGLFLVSQGRFYYPAPVYPMLIAAGCCWAERSLPNLSGSPAAKRGFGRYSGLIIATLLVMAVTLPLAEINSTWWKISATANSEIREEVGWQELVQTTAGIRAALPAAEQASVGILAGNYGEAAAINLYGPMLGLPRAISGVDTYWLRGYGNPPQTLIVIGFPETYVREHFQSCQLAGHTSNRYGLLNEETRDHPDIFVCHQLNQPWPDFWKALRYFG